MCVFVSYVGESFELWAWRRTLDVPWLFIYIGSDGLPQRKGREEQGEVPDGSDHREGGSPWRAGN